MQEYHYTECGLDNIIVIDGIIEEIDEEGDEVIVIHAINPLHEAIAEELIKASGILNGREIRYLRTQMGLTQAELAQIVHKEEQTIARWEKNKTALDAAQDVLLRQIVAERLGIALKKTTEQLTRERVATAHKEPIILKYSGDGKKPSYSVVKAKVAA